MKALLQSSFTPWFTCKLKHSLPGFKTLEFLKIIEHTQENDENEEIFKNPYSKTL